jgi:hypothetical protein
MACRFANRNRIRGWGLLRPSSIRLPESLLQTDTPSVNFFVGDNSEGPRSCRRATAASAGWLLIAAFCLLSLQLAKMTKLPTPAIKKKNKQRAPSHFLRFQSDMFKRVDVRDMRVAAACEAARENAFTYSLFVT